MLGVSCNVASLVIMTICCGLWLASPRFLTASRAKTAPRSRMGGQRRLTRTLAPSSLVSCPGDTFRGRIDPRLNKTSFMTTMASRIRLERSSPVWESGDPILGCMIYTYHKSRQKLSDALRTWAMDCDRLYVFSDEVWVDPFFNVSTIEVHPKGPKIGTNGNKYGENMWAKL